MVLGCLSLSFSSRTLSSRIQFVCDTPNMKCCGKTDPRFWQERVRALPKAPFLRKNVGICRPRDTHTPSGSIPCCGIEKFWFFVSMTTIRVKFESDPSCIGQQPGLGRVKWRTAGFAFENATTTSPQDLSVWSVWLRLVIQTGGGVFWGTHRGNQPADLPVSGSDRVRQFLCGPFDRAQLGYHASPPSCYSPKKPNFLKNDDIPLGFVIWTRRYPKFGGSTYTAQGRLDS